MGEWQVVRFEDENFFTSQVVVSWGFDTYEEAEAEADALKTLPEFFEETLVVTHMYR